MDSVVLAFASAGLRLTHRRSRKRYLCSAAAHGRLADHPRLFCGPTAGVVGLSAGPASVDLTTAEVPYCRVYEMRPAPPGPAPTCGRPWSVGLNVTVSVAPQDRTFVVARRPTALNGGGAWHVSANEGLQPSDSPGSGGACDLTDAAARTLREELGIDLPTDQLRPVTVIHSLIRVRGTANLWLAGHVSLGRLGVTFDDVAASHAFAEEGWESEELTAVAAEDFEAWAASRMWTPWGRTCWDATISACYPELAA